MELVSGIVVGAVLVAVAIGIWEGQRRGRQIATLEHDIGSLALPLLVVQYPSGRLHVSPPLREDIALGDDALTAEMAIDELVHEEDRVPVRQALAELRSGAHSYRELAFRLRMRDGRWHEMLAQGFLLRSFGLRSSLVAVSLENRTQTREVEEERDRLFNLSLDLLAIGDLSGRFLQVNPAWVRVLRWSRDDILDRTWVDLVHPDDRDRAAAALEDLRAGSPVRDLELRTLARDGSHRWISWSSFPLTARRTVFTAARDITDRKAAEAELDRYQQRLRQLASQLSTVEEREMRRLAEILHDTLAQDLFAAQAKLALLEYPERVDDPASVRREVADILRHATELSRTLTFELFPPALYEVGLDAALEWLCRSFRQTRDLPCEFHCEQETGDLPVEQRTLLYQGARERLGNVFKHAEAHRAAVNLRVRDGHIELQVDDDGRGFDFTALGRDAGEDRAGGFGLFNIRERLGQVGGQLGIETSHLGGGRVTLVLPVAPAAS